ncbi:hypothetical protein TNCT_157251 [Trichonephila clavata]|uniref:Uncharacterized protein n=1 Tax=Trichonephila clavata TaxID=2740835 RepID=A0A8X6FN03_TRICU|nr:hypothetical protein TNCT_157251 [Trichonephila clavata]
MRQLIAVTPDNSNRNAGESGSSRRWNNQAYDGVNKRTAPLRFQSKGYGQPHQSHMNLTNRDAKINQTCGTIHPKGIITVYMNIGSISKKIDLVVIDTELPYIILGLEYLHLFELDISIRKMCVFQFDKNLSNVKISNNKCVSELGTYHGAYFKTLKNDKLMNYSNTNHENNSNVKGNNCLDQIPDSSEADMKTLFNPAMVVEDTVPKQTSEQWEDLPNFLTNFKTYFHKINMM